MHPLIIERLLRLIMAYHQCLNPFLGKGFDMFTIEIVAYIGSESFVFFDINKII